MDCLAFFAYSDTKKRLSGVARVDLSSNNAS